jgi:hypothetical protein
MFGSGFVCSLSAGFFKMKQVNGGQTGGQREENEFWFHGVSFGSAR